MVFKFTKLKLISNIDFLLILLIKRLVPMSPLERGGLCACGSDLTIERLIIATPVVMISRTGMELRWREDQVRIAIGW